LRASSGRFEKLWLRALTCASGCFWLRPAGRPPSRQHLTSLHSRLPTPSRALAVQAKMQLVYRSDVVSHATASPVQGQLEKHAALEQLLRGTGLEASTATRTLRPFG